MQGLKFTWDDLVIWSASMLIVAMLLAIDWGNVRPQIINQLAALGLGYMALIWFVLLRGR